jgi:tetratricopeptide (TPR) repeat protein
VESSWQDALVFAFILCSSLPISMSKQNILRFLYVFFIAIFVFACQSPKEKQLAHLRNLEANDSTFSDTLISELKLAYLDFVKKYPADPQNAEFLFKAAQRCIYLDQPKEAIEHLNQLLKDFPKSSLIEETLFLKAYTLENSLHDFKSAKDAYQEFLSKYPKGELATDAQFSIEHMGESADELLKEAH